MTLPFQGQARLGAVQGLDLGLLIAGNKIEFEVQDNDGFEGREVHHSLPRIHLTIG
jgi:hypothetical protein